MRPSQYKAIQAFQIAGDKNEFSLSVPEKALWLHALLRAYLDYFEYIRDFERLENVDFTEKTKEGYRLKKLEAKANLRKLKNWFKSNQVYVTSFMWICQVLTTEADDGSGLARMIRWAITQPQKTVDSSHRFRLQYKK